MLSSEARVGVLRELVRHGGELSAPQLVTRTGFAQSSVREALISLKTTRIIDGLGAGKALLYRINAHHPLSNMLERLFALEEERYDSIIREIGEFLTDRFKDKIEAIWLFGSVARGEDTFASDLDLAIVVDDDDGGDFSSAVKGCLRPLENRLFFVASIVALTSKDVARLKTENAPLLRALESDAIAILGKRPEEFLRQKRGSRRQAA